MGCNIAIVDISSLLLYNLPLPSSWRTYWLAGFLPRLLLAGFHAYHFCRARLPEDPPFIAFLMAPNRFSHLASTYIPLYHFSAPTGITILAETTFFCPNPINRQINRPVLKIAPSPI